MKWLIVLFMVSVIVLAAVTAAYLIWDVIAEGREEPGGEIEEKGEGNGLAEEFELFVRALPKEQRAVYEEIRKYALSREAEGVTVNGYKEYRIGGRPWLRLKIEDEKIICEALWPDCNPEHYAVV